MRVRNTCIPCDPSLSCVFDSLMLAFVDGGHGGFTFLKNPAKFKSLISFGEILDPASKAAVLNLDNSVQMRVQMRGAFSSELQVRAHCILERGGVGTG